jgi:hypothetical protein
LLKISILKHELIAPFESLDDYANTKNICVFCFTKNKKTIELKQNVINKLNEYVFDWKAHLERLFDKFRQTRLKSNYDINNLNDLNSFLRQSVQTYHSNQNGSYTLIYYSNHLDHSSFKFY